MRAVVDEETCTGCGLCVDVCPEVFDLPGDVAVVKTNPVPKENEDSCREAAESCHVEAISLEE